MEKFNHLFHFWKFLESHYCILDRHVDTMHCKRWLDKPVDKMALSTKLASQPDKQFVQAQRFTRLPPTTHNMGCNNFLAVTLRPFFKDLVVNNRLGMEIPFFQQQFVLNGEKRGL